MKFKQTQCSDITHQQEKKCGVEYKRSLSIMFEDCMKYF